LVVVAIAIAIAVLLSGGASTVREGVGERDAVGAMSSA
jgi:hypothetical protein